MFKILIALFIILLPFKSFAEIKVLNWNEKINLTSIGKESEVIMVVKIANLAKNQYHDGFTFSFNSKQNIAIKKVMVDNRNVQYSFQENSLKIPFISNKSNHEQVTINFSYSEKYEKIYEFLRRETIYIPAFARGALANIEVKYPWSLHSVTLNKNIKKFNNKFVYRGLVPENGVIEIVKLTNFRNSWNIKIKNNLKAQGNIAELKVSIPNYFQNSGGQKSGYQLTSNPPVKVQINKNKNVLEFQNLKNQNVSIEIKSQINTGDGYRSTIKRNPANYLNISAADKSLLTPILQKIKQDPNLKDFPLYAKIGKYVHNNIKYDISYLGKLPSLGQILTTKTGVCTEYAKLYNVLARLAGIPSLTVVGAAYGEYNGFEGHAWNLIYHNNHWIYVDPTWDLMSGIVSSSHIYFYDDGFEQISANWSAIKGQGTVKLDDLGNNFKIQKIR